MRKCVGNIEMHGKRIDYFVFGSRKAGYGVEITETSVEKANQIVSSDLVNALNFARKLRRCSVFPANLTEIAQDFGFGNDID